MDPKQALDILSYGIDLALANGTFKKRSEAISVLNALATLEETLAPKPAATDPQKNGNAPKYIHRP